MRRKSGNYSNLLSHDGFFQAQKASKPAFDRPGLCPIPDGKVYMTLPNPYSWLGTGWEGIRNGQNTVFIQVKCW